MSLLPTVTASAIIPSSFYNVLRSYWDVSPRLSVGGCGADREAEAPDVR